jgi:gluconolactonase
MTLRRVAATDAHEGPVVAGGVLYFTSVRRADRVDIRSVDLRTGAVTTIRERANAANGMALGADGRLVVCEQGTLTAPARIAALDPATGATQTLTDAWRGRPLNSPNDVCVARDGTIWFTDPAYGHLQGFRPPPQAGDHVYRLDPSGRTVLAARGFDQPTGNALSPDARTHYVGDSEACVVQAFDVEHGRLRNRRLFARIAPGYPDGLKVDPRGRVLVTYEGGLLAFDRAGRRVGSLDLPGAVNVALAPDGRVYITTDTAVWAAEGAFACPPSAPAARSTPPAPPPSSRPPRRSPANAAPVS